MKADATGQTMHTNHEQTQQAPNAESADRTQSNHQWVKLPEGLSAWLTKRIEFAVPVWAVATAGLVLAVLVFD